MGLALRLRRGAGKIVTAVRTAYIVDRARRSKRLADLQLWHIRVGVDCGAKAMSDQADRAGVGIESVAGTQLVSVGNTLCRQHQQQQDKAQVATQDVWRDTHNAAMYSSPGRDIQ